MNRDERLEAAIDAVRNEAVDPKVVESARARVERRLLAAAGTAEEHRIRGCEGFRELLAAYDAGALAEERRLLVEDHLSHCVPCRRALAERRRRPSTGGPETPARTLRRSRPAVRWALAAGLAGAVALAGAFWASRAGIVGPDASATVRSIEGELLALDGSGSRTLRAGDRLERGERVRTGTGSGALLTLADGSRVELAARSELELARRGDGVVLDLGRGALIVEAAEQRDGHLYVRTSDCTVSVVGTIFSVRHGMRGSRVSVLDGEVRVRRGAELAVLRPGDQLATTARLGRVPLRGELAWSRNAAEYESRIAALSALGRELDATFATDEGRTSTRLLELAPAGTALWIGLPNLSDELGDAWAIFERRLTEDPALAAWWSEEMAGEKGEALAFAVERLRELGSALGPEIGVAVRVDGEGEPKEPIALAEITDRGALERQLAELEARLAAEGDSGSLVRVDDPATAPLGAGHLFVWPSPDGIVVVTPSPTALSEMAATMAGNTATDPFRKRVAEAYRDGTNWIFAADLERLLAKPRQEGAALAATGFDGASLLLVEHRTIDGTAETDATVGFSAPRSGLASWLGAPAPIGALDFVSPEASIVVAGVTKRPVEMVDDLLRIVAAERGAASLDGFDDAQAKLGFSLRDDLAASLGGDAAFAFDGPVLPTPSWKLVVEVIDPSRFEYVLGRIVEAIDREAVAHEQPGWRLVEEAVDGRRYLRIERADGAIGFETSFADGYLVMAPTRALVRDAVAIRDAGVGFATSGRFLDQLPRDRSADVSALVWRDLGRLGELVGQLATAGSELDAEQVDRLRSLLSSAGPSLVVAYGEASAVRIGARGGEGPFGVSLERLFGLAALASGRVDDATAAETGGEGSA